MRIISYFLRVACCLLLALTVAGCQSVTTFDDPSNTYTPEATYQKLIGQYPFISIANRNVPASVREIKNITYVRYGQRALQLDMYLPKRIQQQNLPAVLFVHGGGWRAGYRTNFTAFAIAMADRGYVAATMSYRLSPEAKYPAAIHDTKAAIRWLRTYAKKYGVHPEQIAIAGGSAGGQIASLTGVTGDLVTFDPQAKSSRISSSVQAIINIDGLSDFTSETARFYEDDPRKNPSAAGAWFGGRYAEKMELWHEASPIFYVNKNTPPILFLISAQARFSVGHKEKTAKMKPLGIPYQIVQIPDTPHSFWLFDPWLQPSVDAVVHFLDEQFKVVRSDSDR
ncbi:alpha/beta hydrolase [Cellvibrio sp. pealriver]|uniref:alpha/beta hydrolase n=1 Tax=Cellvibrio sp. pealriver TaxID=1622269 RepID=UPI00066FF054|nr:alpha/beta hydrolase [Cellvibrio sp. pealriver]